MRIRILTLNAGLLKIFGRSLPTPFVSQRLAALPGQLRETMCEIAVLQEVYGDTRRHCLAESLKDIYPFAVHPRKKRNFGLENGLMTLSRYPASGELELFLDAAPDETLFDSKGFLVTQHWLSKDITLKIVNLHTTAGGAFRRPEHRAIDLIRSRQIKQVLNRVQGLGSPLIVAGDLNAGPGVSESNFHQLMEAGFVSLHDWIHGQTSEATWDPENPLNSNGLYKICPPQRIDHLFVKSTDLAENRISAVSSTICLKEPTVNIRDKKAVTVSDHFGICAEINVSIDPIL